MSPGRPFRSVFRTPTQDFRSFRSFRSFGANTSPPGVLLRHSYAQSYIALLGGTEAGPAPSTCLDLGRAGRPWPPPRPLRTRARCARKGTNLNSPGCNPGLPSAPWPRPRRGRIESERKFDPCGVEPPVAYSPGLHPGLLKVKPVGLPEPARAGHWKFYGPSIANCLLQRDRAECNSALPGCGFAALCKFVVCSNGLKLVNSPLKNSNLVASVMSRIIIPSGIAVRSDPAHAGIPPAMSSAGEDWRAAEPGSATPEKASQLLELPRHSRLRSWKSALRCGFARCILSRHHSWHGVNRLGGPLVCSNQARSNPVKPNQADQSTIENDRTRSRPIKPNPARGSWIEPDQGGSCSIKADQGSEPGGEGRRALLLWLQAAATAAGCSGASSRSCFINTTVNSEPSPTVLVTLTLPPWASTTALTRLNPRPRPRWLRLLSPR